MAHQQAKETAVAGCGASLLVLTELGFVERILLPRLEGEISPRESHAQQAVALLLKLTLHAHGIGLLNTALADQCSTGGADPRAAGLSLIHI